MAASATNASREIAAVTGVAILGSLVISQLRPDLTVQLSHLGIPAQFQAPVINPIETGQIPQNNSAYAGYGKIVQEVKGSCCGRFTTCAIFTGQDHHGAGVTSHRARW